MNGLLPAAVFPSMLGAARPLPKMAPRAVPNALQRPSAGYKPPYPSSLP